jgi:hypothetical protein
VDVGAVNVAVGVGIGLLSVLVTLAGPRLRRTSRPAPRWVAPGTMANA